MGFLQECACSQVCFQERELERGHEILVCLYDFGLILRSCALRHHRQVTGAPRVSL